MAPNEAKAQGCELLGSVTGEVEASWLRFEGEEMHQAEIALTEAALAKYGAASAH
jgi:hypothetical protein